MNDILRTFRIGTINLLGVTIPGLMFLLLIAFGCVAPILLDAGFWFNITIPLGDVPIVGRMSGSALAAVTLVLAYVVGYIFRLSTPDVLDKRSAKKVLKKMRANSGQDAPEKDHWPYRGEPENKFPYFHFRDYLRHRKHKELAEIVAWDSNRRSKTFVNKMKFETALRCPTLSAILDSNEAHVRLMFGTWLACLLALPFIAVGFVGTVVVLWGKWPLVADPAAKVASSGPALLPWLAISGFLFAGTFWAIWRIENLFHYRRVRELFDIVECYHLATQAFDLNGSPRMNTASPTTPNEQITKSVESSQGTAVKESV